MAATFLESGLHATARYSSDAFPKCHTLASRAESQISMPSVPTVARWVPSLFQATAQVQAEYSPGNAFGVAPCWKSQIQGAMRRLAAASFDPSGLQDKDGGWSG